jgi:glycosyltransferase involved in cell wall biosynthesis
VLALAERAGERVRRARYSERTGNERAAPGEWRFASHVRHAYGLARAALAQEPDFVLGHEVNSYGLATAWCRGVRRALFPWGGDVFLYAESSPFVERVVRRALEQVELIVPSSLTGAAHIRERYGIPSERVRAVSWGVDLARFRPAEGERALAIRAKLGITPDAQVVMNARRFLPLWGAFEALDALIATARRRADVHGILLGGGGTESAMREARARVEGAGLAPRFTLFEGNATLEQVAEAMSVSSVFLSLLGKGDMRSSSVLQAAACGAAPVLLEAPEYRAMERDGFRAAFVDSREPRALEAAIESWLADPAQRVAVVTSNRRWLEVHEDQVRQMDLLLELVRGDRVPAM